MSEKPETVRTPDRRAADGRPRASSAFLEIGAISRELRCLDRAADTACIRDDAARLADVAEDPLALHVQFAERRRSRQVTEIPAVLAVGRRDFAADAACWRAIAPLRRQRPRWVGVIWHADSNQYRARPRFRAPFGTVATGATPTELAASMDEIERASGPSLRSATPPPRPAAP